MTADVTTERPVDATVEETRPRYGQMGGDDVPVGAIRSPWNPRAAYVFEPETGTVLVTTGRRWGRFTPFGVHLEGALFEADPELCIWISRPRPTSHHRTSRVVDMPGER